jgi:O-antigen ligase
MPLATVHGLGAAAEELGVVVAALLAAVVVLGRPPRVSDRARALAAIGAVGLTPVLLVADIWNTSQLHSLRHHPAIAAAAILLGGGIVAALAVIMHRRPAAIALLAVAALPFRLPISSGGTTSNLLIPVYLVVGAGILAFAVPRLRAADERIDFARRPDEDPVDADAPVEPAPAGLEWLLMGFVVLYAVQSAYSNDFTKALQQLVFFYVPFSLLFALLRRVRWNARLLVACLGIVVVEALVFAGIGFVEYSRRELLLNPKVVAANQYDNYFRVNSLFFDPSIYGRFLALVMLCVTTVVLWSRRQRDVLVGGAVLLWLLGGLITSFSQSSIAALLLGLAVLAAWRWDVRRTLAVCLIVLAAGVAIVVFAPSGSHIGLSSSKSADSATSGRATLVRHGLSLFADRPLQGFGPGSFPLEYRRHNHTSTENATSASHTIPITVAAEQGIVGLALYIALVVAAFWRLFAGARASPARIALAACFAALVVHTMTYADFLEDPVTWTLLGIGSALALSGLPTAAERYARRRERAAAASPAAGAVGAAQ